MKRHSSIHLLSLTVTLTVALQNTFLSPGQTEPVMGNDGLSTPTSGFSTPSKPGSNLLKFIAPEATRPYPGERSPGTGKDDCPDVKLPLTVLMPSLPNGNTFDTWGQTLQERPVLWVYVPYGSEPQTPGGTRHKFDLELRIKEDSPNQTWKSARIRLPKQGKIMPISLPADYQLDLGKNYEVQLAANCVKNNPVQARFWLQRVKLPGNKAIDASAPPSRDRIKLLAENGIWLDTLTEVVKFNNAPQFNPEWQTFIQASLGWDLQESTEAGKQEKEKVEKILQESIN